MSRLWLSTKEKQNTEENKNMKRKLQIIISASAASVLAFSALAQDTPNPKTDRPDYTRQRMAHWMWNPAGSSR